MTPAWTSRKRVEAALAHEEPDRVPMAITITEIPHVCLREHIGLPPVENLRPDRFCEVVPGVDLLETLGFDMTWVKLRGPQNWSAPPPLPDGSVLDEWGVGRKYVNLPNGSRLYEVTHAPLQHLDPAEIDLDAYPWPDPSDPGRTAGLEDEARKLYETTDLAIMGRFGGTIMEMAAFIRGYEEWLMDLVLHPGFARDLMNRIAESPEKRLSRIG